MAAKTTHREPTSLLQWIYERGEHTAEQLLEEMLGPRKVGDGVARTIRGAAQTKGRLDRNMQALLALLNVPSRADYNKLLTKIEALQGSLINLNMKLDRLLAQSAPRPKARRKGRSAASAPVTAASVSDSE